MALIAVAADKGSPGVTTSALALAAVWPRPVVLAECDPSGGDLIFRLPAADGGRLDGRRGVLSLAVAARRGVAPGQVWEHVQKMHGGLDVLAGVTTAEQGSGLEALWGAVGAVLAGLPEADVIADCGRVGVDGPFYDLLAQASATLLITGASLGEVVRLRERASALAGGLARRGTPGARIQVVIIASPRHLGAATSEVGEALGPRGAANVAGGLAFDPKSADSLRGEWGGKLDKSLLIRTARDLVTRLASELAPPVPGEAATAPAGPGARASVVPESAAPARDAMLGPRVPEPPRQAPPVRYGALRPRVPEPAEPATAARSAAPPPRADWAAPPARADWAAPPAAGLAPQLPAAAPPPTAAPPSSVPPVPAVPSPAPVLPPAAQAPRPLPPGPAAPAAAAAAPAAVTAAPGSPAPEPPEPEPPAPASPAPASPAPASPAPAPPAPWWTAPGSSPAEPDRIARLDDLLGNRSHGAAAQPPALDPSGPDGSAGFSPLPGPTADPAETRSLGTPTLSGRTIPPASHSRPEPGDFGPPASHSRPEPGDLGPPDRPAAALRRPAGATQWQEPEDSGSASQDQSGASEVPARPSPPLGDDREPAAARDAWADPAGRR